MGPMVGFLAVLGSFFGVVEGLPEPFQVVPMPKEVVVSSTQGLLGKDIKYLAIHKDRRLVTNPEFELPANMQHFKKTPVGSIMGPMPNIFVQIGLAELPSSDGYKLTSNSNEITIEAETDAGAFYGLQTLSQLIEDSIESGQPIPTMTITDWPDIEYRAVHFDTKHHMDTMDTYYKAIDRLANLKVNAIIWEFEDKLRYRKQPKVGAENAISIEQMRALTAYAKRRFIEISPLVQGLGHASFILKHDEYKHLRDDPKSDWAFCPINEDTYEVQFDLYLDAIEATPGSRYLHIGGDEVHVGVSDLAKRSGKDPLELHLHWLNKVNDFLVEQGRIPIMWDDMPLKHGGVYPATHNGSFNQDKTAELWGAKRNQTQPSG